MIKIFSKKMLTNSLALSFLLISAPVGVETIFSNEAHASNFLGYRYVNKSTNLYQYEGYGSVLTTLNVGNKLELYSTTGTYVKVKDVSTGKIGYVDRGCLGTAAPTVSNTNQKIEQVIAVAYKQLGKPYVYGAAGPNSFDCSGLTSYCFKTAIGKTIPRTSGNQAKTGTYVSLSNLKRGDLLFFGNKSTGKVSHVAIYLGNNEYIHSPQTGDVVKITKTSSSHYINKALYGRRIL